MVSKEMLADGQNEPSQGRRGRPRPAAEGSREARGRPGQKEPGRRGRVPSRTAAGGGGKPVATVEPGRSDAPSERPVSRSKPAITAPANGAGSPPAERKPDTHLSQLAAPPAAEIAAKDAQLSAPVAEPQPVPETPVPRRSVPQRSAPETPAPRASVPPTPAPERAVPETHVSLPYPPESAGRAPDPAAMLGASRTLVEGTLRAQGQMIGFTCRQAEHGLAVGRAMLTSGSLPAALALQARYFGQAFDDALAQTLELSRLSTELMRAGLQSLGRG